MAKNQPQAIQDAILESTALTVVQLDFDPNLPESLREDLYSAFAPHYAMLQDMEAEFEAITGADVTVHTLAISKRAKDLRMKYVAWRGTKGLKKTHEDKKAYFRLVGSSIDNLERIGRNAAQEREEKLLEIEKFQENQLQETRSEAILEYMQEGIPMRTDLGVMSEDMWEAFFLGTRAKFQTVWEEKRKEALRTERMKETSMYALFIPDYNEIEWENLTDSAFATLVASAKGKREKEEKEAAEANARAKDAEAKLELQRLASEEALRKQREESEAKQKKFSARVASVKGASLQEDGLHYKGKRICTLKSLQDKPDEEFTQFVTAHNERFDADTQADILRAQAEKAAEVERNEERMRMAADNARMQAEKSAADAILAQGIRDIEAKRSEEEAAKGAPERERVEAFLAMLTGIEYPECKSEKGAFIIEKSKAHIEKLVQFVFSHVISL